MGEDILKTGSSLSEIINKQQKANVSCEESQTLFDYYVSTLQANFKAPRVANKRVHRANDTNQKDPPNQCLFPNVDEVDKLDFQNTDTDNEPEIVILPLAEISRKRLRYPSPLETIEECDHHIQGQSTGNVCSEPELTFESANKRICKLSNSTTRTTRMDGKSFRSTNDRTLAGGVQMIYQTEVWTQEDENDCLCEENKLLLKEKNTNSKSTFKQCDLHESKRVTNSFQDANRSLINKLTPKSKITPIDGKPQESYNSGNSVSSTYIINAEDDGAISVMPKLSVVDIHSYHVRLQSRRLEENSCVYTDVHSGTQEFQSLKADSQLEYNYLDATWDQDEKEVDSSSERGSLQQHTIRKDADKHIEMVKEKQQRAKELFSKLRSIDDVVVQNIASSSSIILETSIKKCALLSRSTSFEPEEVISVTTNMLDELTNLISSTTNQIRQKTKESNAEGENLTLMPFLSGPRSTSSLFSSTETLMSPVRLNSSSLEMESANLFRKQVMSEVVSPGIVNTFKNETQDSSDSEYEVFKCVDLISFGEDNVPSKLGRKCSETKPLPANLMDAELEELPGWQKNKTLIGAEEIMKQWEGNESRTPEHASSNVEPTSKNGSQKVKGNASNRIQGHSTSYTNNTMPVNLGPKSSNRSAMHHERDITSKTHLGHSTFSQNITQPSPGHTKNTTQGKYGNKQNNVLPNTGIQTRELRASSPRKDPTVSDTHTSDKHQQHASASVLKQRIKTKDSSGASCVRTSNKHTNQLGQAARQNTVQAKNEQKKKSNTLTLKVKSKENKSFFRANTVRDNMKETKLSKQVQLNNKTLERNLSNICYKINCLRSGVADSNACEESVIEDRMVVEENVDDNLPVIIKVSSENKHLNKKGHTNRTKITNITDNTERSEVSEVKQKKTVHDTCKGVFTLAHKLNNPRPNPPRSYPGITKEIPRRTNIIGFNCMVDGTHQKNNSTHNSHPESDSNKRSKSITKTHKETNAQDKFTKHSKNVLLSSTQNKSATFDKSYKHACLQAKRDSHTSKILSEPKRNPERTKRLLSRQEIQDWVNLHHHHSHGRRSSKHSTKRCKQNGSPTRKKHVLISEGIKSSRDIPRRAQSESPNSRRRRPGSRSKQTKRCIEQDHTSSTDLVSIHSSPCIERTASQLLMDTLTDTVEFGLRRSLSSKRALHLENKFSNLSVNAAMEIVHKISNFDDDSSEHSSSLDATINHLVKSLDSTIHLKKDKRICWDSSTDIPPRNKTALDETHLEIVETGSRVLETIKNKLLRQLRVQANNSRCRDDPETEVSFNSKRVEHALLSPISFEETVLDATTFDEKCKSVSRTRVITHKENVNTLMGVLKSTSDGGLADRCISRNRNIPSGVTEAKHAMAALEDLQALLSSLRNNMNEQSRTHSHNTPVPRMIPLSAIPKVKECSEPSSPIDNDPEATVETRGDTTIITTARAPIKRAPEPIIRRKTSSVFSKHSPRTVWSNTSTTMTSSNSTRSYNTTGSVARSPTPHFQTSKLQRSQTRSGYTRPSSQSGKPSSGNISEHRTRPSPTPTWSQNQGRWLKRNADLSLPAQTTSTKTVCSRPNSNADNASVRSSSSCSRKNITKTQCRYSNADNASVQSSSSYCRKNKTKTDCSNSNTDNDNASVRSSSSYCTKNDTKTRCSNSNADNTSVRSSSSYCTSRVYRLAQPNKRYLEATKIQHNSVLRQHYLERLNKKIHLAESKIPPTSTKEKTKTKFCPRKRVLSMSERIKRKVTRMMKFCSDDDDKEKPTCKRVNSSSGSEIEDAHSLHYNSPSDESQIADINNREYYHYSDKSDYAAPVLNSVEFGGILYVGIEKKPKLTTSEEFLHSPSPVNSDVTLDDVNQKNSCIEIDVDTWNMITQNCIENFRQEEETFIFQTAIPKHNEVTISELTGSQEDFINNAMAREKGDNLIEGSHNMEDKTSVHVVNSSEVETNKQQAIVLSAPSTMICQKYSLMTGIDSLLSCCTQGLLKNDGIPLPTSGLANISENSLSSKKQDLLPTDKISVDSVICATILKNVSEVNKSESSSTSSNTDSQSTSDNESTTIYTCSSNGDIMANWKEIDYSNIKKYHPKQSIPNEIALALEENYDPAILFDIVRQYLSSDSETNIPKIVELEEQNLDLHNETEEDLCGLYETFSYDDVSEDDVSRYNAAQSISNCSGEISYSSMFDAFPLYINKANLVKDSGVSKKSSQTNIRSNSNEYIESSTTGSEREILTVGEHSSGTFNENVSDVTDYETDNSKYQMEYDTEYSQTSLQTNVTSGSQYLSQTSSESYVTAGSQSQYWSQNSSETEQMVTSETKVSIDLSKTQFTDETQRVRQNTAQPERNNDKISLNTSKTKSEDQDSTKSTPNFNGSNVDLAGRKETQNPSEMSTKVSDSVIQNYACATLEQHCSTEDNTVESTHGQSETTQEPSFSTEIVAKPPGEDEESTSNLSLELIVAPPSRLILSVNNSTTTSTSCSEILPSVSCHSVLEALTSDTPSCGSFPVLDITSEDTVRNLLGSLTHEAFSTSRLDTEATDDNVQPCSMDTLLRHFSNISIPGYNTSRVNYRETELLDSFLDSLAIGMHSKSTIQLIPRQITIEDLECPSILDIEDSLPPSANVIPDAETTRSDRDMQTDDAHINWPSLSNKEIRLAGSQHRLSSGTPPAVTKAESDPGLVNRHQDTDEDTCVTVSSPGLLFQAEMNDLPYVGDPERQSVMDLAMYTDILLSYSSSDRFADFLSSLEARAVSEERTERAASLLAYEPNENSRKVVIKTIAYFLVTFILFGVYTIRSRCE